MWKYSSEKWEFTLEMCAKFNPVSFFLAWLSQTAYVENIIYFFDELFDEETVIPRGNLNNHYVN